MYQIIEKVWNRVIAAIFQHKGRHGSRNVRKGASKLLHTLATFHKLCALCADFEPFAVKKSIKAQSQFSTQRPPWEPQCSQRSLVIPLRF